jgi:hypothetical protein
MLIVTVVCILIISAYFLEVSTLGDLANVITKWVSIIAGFALILGAINLVILNARHVIKRTPRQWFYSLVIIVLFFITFIAGLLPPITKHPLFEWIYYYIFTPPSATIYGMLALYMTWAGFRAVRARNVEAAVFLIVALSIVIFNTPLIKVAVPVVQTWGQWLMNVPSMAGWRAFYIGAAIGVIALALRAILWYERGIIGE